MNESTFINYLIEHNAVLFGECVQNLFLKETSFDTYHVIISSAKKHRVLQKVSDLNGNRIINHLHLTHQYVKTFIPDENITVNIYFMFEHSHNAFLIEHQFYNIDLLLYSKTKGYYVSNNTSLRLNTLPTIDEVCQDLLQKKFQFLDENDFQVYYTRNMKRFRKLKRILERGFKLIFTNDPWSNILFSIRTHAFYTIESTFMADLHYVDSKTGIIEQVSHFAFERHSMISQYIMRYILKYKPFQQFVDFYKRHSFIKFNKHMLNLLIEKNKQFLIENIPTIKENFSSRYQPIRDICRYSNELIHFLLDYDIIKLTTAVLDYAFDHAYYYTNYDYRKFYILAAYFSGEELKLWADEKIKFYVYHVDERYLEEYNILIQFTEKRLYNNYTLQFIFGNRDRSYTSILLKNFFYNYSGFFTRHLDIKRKMLRRTDIICHDKRFWSYAYNIPIPELEKIHTKTFLIKRGKITKLTTGKLVQLLPRPSAAVIAVFNGGNCQIPFEIALHIGRFL